MGRTIGDSSAESRTRSAELRLEVACQEQAVEAVAEILREHGAQGVAIEGLSWPVPGDDVRPLEAAGRPHVYCTLPRQGARRLLGAVKDALARRVRPLFGEVDARLREVSGEDWVERFRRSVGPVEVAPDLVVAPPWCDPRAAAPQGQEILWIEPGAAFGSGDHPSTRTALRLLLRVLRAGDDVIDLGSGTGILGAAALLRGAGGLRAYDLDPLAAQETRRTLRRNGLTGRVRNGALPKRTLAADLLVANISGRGLRPMLAQIRGALRPGGRAVLGGILREDAEFWEPCAAAGLRWLAREVEGDWQAIACERP